MSIANLTKEQLTNKLTELNIENVDGTKADLIIRLEEALKDKDEMPSNEKDDNASNISSESSSGGTVIDMNASTGSNDSIQAEIMAKYNELKLKQAEDARLFKEKQEREMWDVLKRIGGNTGENSQTIREQNGTELGSNAVVEKPSNSNVYGADRSNTENIAQNMQIGLNANANVYVPGFEPSNAYAINNMNPSWNTERESNSNQQLLETLISYNLKGLMPKTEIEPFDGNFTMYQNFIIAFEAIIEKNLQNDKEKLLYLEQFTRGAPREIVRGCVHMHPDIGYKKARSLLEKRYGRTEQITNAYLDKILNWPSIKANDVESLDKFSITLTNCSNAMSNIPFHQREIEQQKVIRKLVDKLPYNMQDKFRQKVYDITNNENNRQVTFNDLVSFITTAVEVMSHPIFGKQINSSSNDTKEKQDKKNYKVNCNTASIIDKDNKACNSTKEKRPYKPSCLFCKEDHYLDDCKPFIEKSIDERVQFVKDNKICFGCLKPGHLSKDCKRKRKCAVCKLTHPTALHKEQKEKDATDNSKEDKNSNEQLSVKVFSKKVDDDRTTKMSIVPIKVKSYDGSLIKTYAFMDNGSNASFLTNRLLDNLKLKNFSETSITMKTANSVSEQRTKRVNGVTILDFEENNKIELPPIYTLDEIPVSEDEIVTKADLERWPKLSHLDIPECDVEIGILIGNNMPKVSEPWEIIHSSEDNGPYATKTKLGWVVTGSPSEGKQYHRLNRIIIDDQNLDNLLVNVYNQGFEDIYSNDKGPSNEDRIWMEKMKNECKVKDNCYEMPLPIKKDVEMPNNKVMVIKRTQTLINKFKKDDNYYNEYKRFMNEMIENDYAEEVPKEEIDNESAWYIPHFGVYHPKKPDKLRVVFDCAAKYSGQSLNMNLMQGPDLTNSLLVVLMRFRKGLHAYVADIKQMFYQVRMAENSKDFIRFLWWEHGDYSKPLKDYRMNVHLFGATSSPSCANYALQKTAEDNIEYYSEDACQTIKKNFYVDDLLKSDNDELNLIKNALEVKDLCHKGGFELNKYSSTSKKLIGSLPPNDVHQSVSKIEFDKNDINSPQEKTLGICWKINEDVFSVEVNVKEKPFTRRGILSIVGSVYDPFGIVSPFILNGKIILQELCREGLSWDQPISEIKAQEWKNWLTSLKTIESVTLKRCLTPESRPIVYELHHFADASAFAYAIVSYLRVICEDGSINCTFLYGKCYVAPLKVVTIPRLELAAAVLLIKSDEIIKKALDFIVFNNVYFWSDSQAVLKYIYNENVRFHVYVANRVATIRQHTSKEQWKYVPSSENPADDGSRGAQTSRWIKGPQFLLKNDVEWPDWEIDPKLGNDDKEVKNLKVNTLVTGLNDHPLDKLIEYHSNWHKLKKATAWLILIRERLLKRNNERRTHLKVNDLKKAENVLIKHVQKKDYEKEFKNLSAGKPIEKSSKLVKFNPIINNGIIRIGGRLQFSKLSYSEKHPIILPGKSRISRLIIQEVHNDLGHSGREHVLSKIRDKYWITKGSSTVRGALSKCIKCKKLKAPVVQQVMSDIPVERMAEGEPPFTNTGLDLFGPFYTKVNRSQVKRYGVIFTCLTSRAIHIEIAFSLDTSSFINALRRFTARRGPVKYIRSDQGSNFVGANNELVDAIKSLDNDKIEENLLKKEIQWDFNPPYSSHHGGIWERQIRTIRKVLDGILTEQTLTDESLLTLMCEVENIINSRPLTTVSSDSNDLNPITPNLLLNAKGNNSEYGKFHATDVYSKKRWRQIQYMSDLFWKRWRSEFLKTIQKRNKWFKKKENVKIDDIVLICDNNSPRCQWPLGRIVEVKTSKDGNVRSVSVLTKNGMVQRPISKIIVITNFM